MADDDVSPARHRRWPVAAGMALVLSLIGAMAIEPTRQLIEQRRRVAGVTAELEETKRMNRRLAARIDRLEDPDFIEQRAREQIGLVRPGETAFIVMPRTRPKGGARVERARPSAPEEPPEVSWWDGLARFLGVGG